MKSREDGSEVIKQSGSYSLIVSFTTLNQKPGKLNRSMTLKK